MYGWRHPELMLAVFHVQIFKMEAGRGEHEETGTGFHSDSSTHQL